MKHWFWLGGKLLYWAFICLLALVVVLIFALGLDIVGIDPTSAVVKWVFFGLILVSYALPWLNRVVREEYEYSHGIKERPTYPQYGTPMRGAGTPPTKPPRKPADCGG